jgi:triacylglycerol lipase
MPAPVLLVHGIWDTAKVMGPLKTGLLQRGLGPVHALDLVPRGGRASIAELGKLVAVEANALAAREGARRIDIVGFSMGALVARWYVQRGGGKETVRRFVSISGPHHGTLNAYALPLTAVREMRPNSALLRELASDPDPFGPVDVHCVYTPFDLMILPAKSSILAGARSVRAIRVAIHGLMIFDRRVQDHVAAVLRD